MIELRLTEGGGMSYYQYGSMNKAAQLMSKISSFDQVNQQAIGLNNENRQNISDYNNILGRFRALRMKYNSLVNEWNKLENSKYNLNKDYTSLIETHNDLVEKFNALVEQNDSLLADFKKFELNDQNQIQLKESEILRLIQNLRSTQKVASETIADVNHQNALLKNKVNALQLFKSSTIHTVNKNKEFFAKEVKKRSRENAKNELALKVTKTQTKIFRQLWVNCLTGDERLKFINEQIIEADSQDNAKNEFSYSEAYAWLKRNETELLSRIDLLI